MTRIQARINKPRRASRVWTGWLAMALMAAAGFLLLRLLLHPVPKAPVSPLAANSQAPAQSPVQFDFYTVLPKMAVSLPSAPTPQLVSAPLLAAAPKPLPAGMYVLQVAAFHQLHDAEHWRDQMHALGYPAFIQPYQAEQTMWYRVMIGPYNSPDLAKHNQEQLRDRHLNALLLKI